VKHSLPWIYAAAVGSYGATLNVVPAKTACLACIFPDSPRGMVETCETSGILNTAVNLVASVAATEAVKLLVGGAAAEQLRKTLWSYDVWRSEQAEIAADSPRVGCRACGERDFVHLAGEGRPHVTMCGRNSVQIHEQARTIDFAEMQQRLESHGIVRHNEFVLKFWRDPYEMTLFPDGRAINMASGILRARYRKGAGRPVFLQPGETYELPIDLIGTSNVFERGHRIRVDVTSSDFPAFDRHLNTEEPFGSGVKPRIAHQTVYHNTTQASYVLLPVITSRSRDGVRKSQ